MGLLFLQNTCFGGFSVIFYLSARLSVIFSALGRRAPSSFECFCSGLFLGPSIQLFFSVCFSTLQSTSFLWILWRSATQLFFMVVLFLQHFIGLPFVPSADFDDLFLSPLLLNQLFHFVVLYFAGLISLSISVAFWWCWRGGGWGLCVQPSSILILFFTILFFLACHNWLSFSVCFFVCLSLSFSFFWCFVLLCCCFCNVKEYV